MWWRTLYRLSDMGFQPLIQRTEAELARAAARTAMWQQWDGLPAWIRGPYRPLFDAANNLLDEGDDEAAAEMILAAEPTAAILADPTVYPELGDVTKQQFFAAVQAQFAAGIAGLGG